MAVTKQQQLKFAAMHIDKWKSGYDFAVIEKMNDGQLCVRWPSICSEGVSKKEWQQERDKMQKQNSSWYERGELPPVGTICEMIDDRATWRECKIIAHEDGACIGWIASLNSPFYTYDKSEFRPLRAEREKAIDAACDVICKNGVHDFERGVITKLYDAGLLK